MSTRSMDLMAAKLMMIEAQMSVLVAELEALKFSKYMEAAEDLNELRIGVLELRQKWEAA